jgi:hypothetical protein
MRTLKLRCITFAIVVCIGVFVNLLCSSQLTEAGEPPAALISYPGATDVRFDEGNAVRVSYRVNSKFPAAPVLGWVSENLRKQGWKPLKYDFLNPGSPSSQVTGWEELMAGTNQPGICVHQWLGSWKDSSGDIVTYAFRYKARGCGASELTDLEVNGWYASAEVARQTQQVLERLKKENDIK